MTVTKSAPEERNCFLTHEIQIFDYDVEDVDRYIFCRACLDKSSYGKEDLSDEEFDEWADQNLIFEERYDVPLMSALYYFPAFIDFSEEDKDKCSSTTCLLYDINMGCWAVGMTGGGMNLAPHLLDTFINLGMGVPYNVALDIQRDYHAFVDVKKHEINCDLLHNALQHESKHFERYASRLSK